MNSLLTWLLVAAGAGTAAFFIAHGSSQPSSPPPSAPRAVSAPASPAPLPAPGTPPPSTSPPPPSSPSAAIPAPSVSPGPAGATITWSDAGRGALGFTVDIDDDGDWNDGFWHKSVAPGATQTDAPSGFQPYNGALGALSLQVGATYRVRVFYPQTG